MTLPIVTDSASVLQTSYPLSSPPQFGRRAYGPQRRVSQETLACYIAESIMTHRQLGQDRPIRFYTDDPDLQALVQANLELLAVLADKVVNTVANPPDVLEIG